MAMDDLHGIQLNDLIQEPYHGGSNELITLNPTFSFDSMSEFEPAFDTAFWSRPPTLDEIESSFNFDVNLPGEQSGKGTWIYSAALKKVFIKMKQVFTINISYTKPMRYAQTPLNLRVMPIYVEPDDQHHPVQRCLNHPTTDMQRPHLLWCNHNAALYVGAVSAVTYAERLAILLPLSDTGYEVNESIGLEFHCQNSCSTGINRRGTAIVFALETPEREVVGKRVMHFKVCSCPKRDKEKEEGDMPGGAPKRKRERGCSPSTSKKKPSKIIIKKEIPLPPADERGNPVGATGTITMPNRRMLQQVYDYASSLVAAEILDNPMPGLESFRDIIKSQSQAMDHKNEMFDSQE